MERMIKLDTSDGTEHLVGVISDTHGYLSERAKQALQGVSLIIHAGDLDQIDILEELAQIAPVSAVRGNMDNGPGVESLPLTQVNQVGEVYIYSLHDLGKLDLDPAAAGFQVVVYGHYHRPVVKQRNGVLYVNPGSASSPRMGTQKSLARLHFHNGNIKTELINLE